MANVGFEPTPFQTSALNWRLRPLGQLTTDNNLHTHKQTQNKPQTKHTHKHTQTTTLQLHAPHALIKRSTLTTRIQTTTPHTPTQNTKHDTRLDRFDQTAQPTPGARADVDRPT